MHKSWISYSQCCGSGPSSSYSEWEPLGGLGSKFGMRKTICLFFFLRIQQPVSSGNVAPIDWCSAILSLYISSAWQKKHWFASDPFLTQQNGPTFRRLVWINFSLRKTTNEVGILLEYLREEYANCISFPPLPREMGLLHTHNARWSLHVHNTHMCIVL